MFAVIGPSMNDHLLFPLLSCTRFSNAFVSFHNCRIRCSIFGRSRLLATSLNVDHHLSSMLQTTNANLHVFCLLKDLVGSLGCTAGDFSIPHVPTRSSLFYARYIRFVCSNSQQATLQLGRLRHASPMYQPRHGGLSTNPQVRIIYNEPI